MKKAKKILLLYFLYWEKSHISRDNYLSYQDLYEALPLSPSTIRGIIQEFVSARWLQKKTRQTHFGWVLTQTGKDITADLFPALYEVEHAQSLTVFLLPRLPAASKQKIEAELSKIDSIQMNAGTYLLFGSLASSSHKKMLQLSTHQILILEQVSASEKEIFSYWLSTSAGMKSYDLRLRIQRATQLYSRTKQSHSPMRSVRQKMCLKIFADIIDARAVGSEVPEIYYPSELRLSFLLEKFLYRK